MKKLFCIILLLLVGVYAVRAQFKCTFTHYSQENGLSENTVMDMVQDHDGMIWLATWDGINRFNGYDFKVYKARKENDMGWSSNRVDCLQVDKAGDVWCLMYDGRAFRFDKRMEAFAAVPADDAAGKELVISSISTLENGTVWLLTENNGGIRVALDPQTGRTVSQVYLSTASGEKGTRIHSVFLDSAGKEWLLTRNGLLRIEAASGKSTSYFINRHGHSSQGNQSFFCASAVGGDICFGSEKGRIWVYSQKGDSFSLKELPEADDVIAIHRLPGQEVLAVTRSCGFGVGNENWEFARWYGSEQGFSFADYPVHESYMDSKGVVWLAVEKTGCVCYFDTASGKFQVEQMDLEKDAADRSIPRFSVCESNEGDLWVHPMGGGLSWFDRESGRLFPFFDKPGSDNWRFSNKLHGMMMDSQGNLWLGTHSKGLEKVTFFKNEFQLIKPLKCMYDTNANQVRSLCEDSRNRFWVGTRDGKISVYSRSLEYLGYLTEQGVIARSGKPLDGSAYKMIEDSKGDLWIATKGDGVVRLHPVGDMAYRVQRFRHDAGDIYSLSHNSVYDVYEDTLGRIWLVTFEGGINYLEWQDDGSARFINYGNNLKSYPMERCYRARRILCDKKGTLWVATSNGLLSFSEKFSRPESIVFKLHARQPNKPDGLSHNDIYDMLLTHNGRLFFATFGGGLNELLSLDKQGNAIFTSFTMKNGLPSDVLTSLAEDAGGNIWIGSESGLSKLDLRLHHFDNYLKRELGEELFFEESTSLHAADGRLLFGTNRGVLSFVPEEIQKNGYVPGIVFSGLKVANEDVMPGGGEILSESLNSIPQLVLSHKENTLTLSFAALDMTFPENIRYAYRLEGFDEDWDYVGKQRTATYTNLPKGDYVFRVKSTNGAGIWMDNERTLKITVQPSFWETPFAYLLYAVSFILVLLAGTYTLFIIYRLKHEVSVEQQVTDMKLRFFTNISHELRTPLTLIGGPVEYILKRTDLDEDMREQLKVVERNTHRMLRLVNQILDFRKIQNHKMKLTVEQVDIVAFVRKIMENFESVAESNKIDFLFESEQPSITLWLDADKVEKIVFNLLSNAFKYTQPGKAITVFIHDNERSVAVGVQDQGIGISESKKNSLFVRFETLLDKNLFNPNSTGIGLSLVKELVEMHRASIRVESKEGEGSCFVVDFLKGKEHYGDDVEFIVSDFPQHDPEAGGESTEELPAVSLTDEADGVSAEQRIMLLVEDNLELRFFLRSIFCRRFRIVEASNGIEGVEMAVKYMPDIIISDIMMPGKDGIVLTRELRDNMATSHIPIVLLTAKTDMESKVEGMELGVDSYITKPFSAVYLEARVNNLLERRQRLRRFYCEHLMDMAKPDENEPKEDAETPIRMSVQDRKFLDRLTELMEERMDDGDLVVDDLVKEMAVSRSVFFKKLKSLTGLAPIEFIKEMRVKRAAQLIETGEFNMTQISYMVGINDPRYFSKCFKQRFGMTPTEYKDRLKEKP